MHSEALIFALLITQLLEDISFKFDPILAAWVPCALIDASS